MTESAGTRLARSPVEERLSADCALNNPRFGKKSPMMDRLRLERGGTQSSDRRER